MRFPLIPTVFVAGAVATMIALGIWQLGRKDEKEALIAHAERALTIPAEVEYPRDPERREEVLYRRTSVTCLSASAATTVAGTSLRGEKGVAQRVSCALANGSTATVDLGFSLDPAPVAWNGGQIQGVIAPNGRIVATEPPEGLEPLSLPDPRDLPNNHLAYAGQWFFFALTALAIYILALRRRSRA